MHRLVLDIPKKSSPDSPDGRISHAAQSPDMSFQEKMIAGCLNNLPACCIQRFSSDLFFFCFFFPTYFLTAADGFSLVSGWTATHCRVSPKTVRSRTAFPRHSVQLNSTKSDMQWKQPSPDVCGLAGTTVGPRNTLARRHLWCFQRYSGHSPDSPPVCAPFPRWPAIFMTPASKHDEFPAAFPCHVFHDFTKITQTWFSQGEIHL